jgi:hypothetical protein
MILALISLNIAVTFFIPMLITKNQITDTVKDIVDKTFLEKEMAQYATQANVADLLRKVSTLLFWQKRYIWSLSCALNALNEYMKIATDKFDPQIKLQIRNMWISIEAMITIIADNNEPLLKKEFPISNKEIKLMEKRDLPEEKIKPKRELLINDKKDMLMRVYIELFELIYRKEDLIHIIGHNLSKQVNKCLDAPVKKIITVTAEEGKIEPEEIKLEIRENSAPFENVETRKTAEETLKDLIKD